MFLKHYVRIMCLYIVTIINVSMHTFKAWSIKNLYYGKI